MNKLTIIEEIAKSLKELPIAFRYLDELKNYKKGIQKQQTLEDIQISNWKPLVIDKYQTSRYMQSGTYFKPFSRIFLPEKEEKPPEMI